jgi:hypothetical protein
MRNPTSGSGSEDEAQKEDPVIRPGPYVENFGVGSDAKALSRQVESRQRSSLLCMIFSENRFPLFRIML